MSTAMASGLGGSVTYVPKPDVEYMLQLGSTMGGPGAAGLAFCSLRYDFTPASINRSAAGVLDQSADSKKVSIHLPNNSTGELDVQYQGRFEPSRDDLDCVAIFDGTTFRLEYVAGQFKTRHIKGAKPYQGSATTPSDAAAGLAATPSVDDGDGDWPAAERGVSPTPQPQSQPQRSAALSPQQRAARSPPAPVRAAAPAAAAAPEGGAGVKRPAAAPAVRAPHAQVARPSAQLQPPPRVSVTDMDMESAMDEEFTLHNSPPAVVAPRAAAALKAVPKAAASKAAAARLAAATATAAATAATAAAGPRAAPAVQPVPVPSQRGAQVAAAAVIAPGARSLGGLALQPGPSARPQHRAKAVVPPPAAATLPEKTPPATAAAAAATTAPLRPMSDMEREWQESMAAEQEAAQQEAAALAQAVEEEGDDEADGQDDMEEGSDDGHTQPSPSAAAGAAALRGSSGELAGREATHSEAGPSDDEEGEGEDEEEEAEGPAAVGVSGASHAAHAGNGGSAAGGGGAQGHAGSNGGQAAVHAASSSESDAEGDDDVNRCSDDVSDGVGVEYF